MCATSSSPSSTPPATSTEARRRPGGCGEFRAAAQSVPPCNRCRRLRSSSSSTARSRSPSWASGFEWSSSTAATPASSAATSVRAARSTRSRSTSSPACSWWRAGSARRCNWTTRVRACWTCSPLVGLSDVLPAPDSPAPEPRPVDAATARCGSAGRTAGTGSCRRRSRGTRSARLRRAGRGSPTLRSRRRESARHCAKPGVPFAWIAS